MRETCSGLSSMCIFEISSGFLLLEFDWKIFEMKECTFSSTLEMNMNKYKTNYNYIINDYT